MNKKNKSIYDLLDMNPSLKIDNKVIQEVNNYFKKSFESDSDSDVKPDDSFQTLTSNLASFLKRYSPIDAIVAINILELWPSNISATFKQAILINTYLSIPEKGFRCKKPLNTYSEFDRFSKHLISLFPEFPMMEDYVPEIDWGEVKFEIENQYYNIFYGGCIERIPDFLQAFLIFHGDKSKAIDGVLYALKLQDHVINQLKYSIELPEIIEKGHMEVPHKDFWSLCKKVITDISEAIGNVSDSLTVELGKERTYLSHSEFSIAFMQSQVNQSLFVNVSNQLYPFAIRNCISVVIDKPNSEPVDTKKVSFELSNFINQRISTSSEVPLQLFDSNEIYPTVVTSVFHHLDKFYFVIILDDDEDTAEDFERSLQKAIQSNYWGFKKVGLPYAFNIKNKDDSENEISRKQVEILYLTGNVSTAMSMCSIPRTGVFFPFSEFISIIDSIESVDELAEFIDFTNLHEEQIYLPMTSMVDKFATFKESNGILEKGAIKYELIALDPHSGSNWRYKHLSSFWGKLIVDIPDKTSKWIPKNSYDNIQFLSANNMSKYTWSTKILNTTIHFLVRVDEFIHLPAINGRMINFFAESTVDSLSQRREIVSQLANINQYQTIIFTCLLDKDYLIDDAGKMPSTNAKFFDSLVWCLDSDVNSQDKCLEIRLSVNILAMKNELDNSRNSEFQGKLAKKILDIVYDINKSIMLDRTIKLLEKSYENKTRVALGTIKRAFDSLESFHALPKLEHYIIARKELAKIIKDKGYKQERFELNEAKELINEISTEYLNVLQNNIQNFNKSKLIIKLLKNYDAYINFKHHQGHRSVQSLEHEVAFNREESIYELQKKFANQGNNHRYIIERLIANNTSGEVNPSIEDMLRIIAYVDWLMTLYSASEVLHHGIEVGGIKIDSEYIPQVFFSEASDEFDRTFGLEQASINLGIGVNEDDEVIGKITEELLEKINLAFKTDLGFTFTTLAIVLDVLQSWADINQIELANYYTASINSIVTVCLKQNSKLLNTKISEQEIIQTINFLTLDAGRVLKKLGSDINEFDVPVLEYNKRDQRLNIKPLIVIDEKALAWSAGCAYRTRHIWLARIAEGCLPANFSWKSVNKVVNSIKINIEKELEKTTFEIFKRYFDSEYCYQGIDFMRRFRKVGFDDVGDFDVLVYIPNSNTWIMVECKYNQTPYCLQDGRRLRDKIFSDSKKTHVPKILKRYDFLKNNHDKVCELLGYASGINKSPKIVMLYVTRQIYWVHRQHPNPIDIQFVQVDKLDDWLNREKVS